MPKPYPILVEALVQIAASNDSGLIEEIARNAARQILSAEAISLIQSGFGIERVVETNFPLSSPTLSFTRDLGAAPFAVSRHDDFRSASCPVSVVGGFQAPSKAVRSPVERVSGHYYGEAHQDTLGEIKAAQTLARAASAAISRCVDVSELIEASARLTLVCDEARHRLKNVYASAIGLANLTLPREHSSEFAQRLRTLAEVHHFLDTEGGENPGILVGELLAGVLSPYHDANNPRILAEGPDIEVDSTIALALGLLANELATNALKYGSLSSSTGQIVIQWTSRAGEFSLCWSEVGGPEPDTTAAPNQGSNLMQLLVKNQLRGRMEHLLTRSGLRFSLRFPTE